MRLMCRFRLPHHLLPLPALLLLAPASPARAQGDPASSTSSPSSSATQALYNAGLEAVKAQDWEKAYAAFSAAWRVRQHPQIALNLGRAALKTRRYVEAAEHLALFLRETKEDVANQDRALVQELLIEAKQQVATLIVKVNRAGAEVIVDGQVVGQAPLSRDVYLDPGKHTVEARLGKESAEPLTVEVGAGQSRQVGLRVEAGTRGAALPRAAGEDEAEGEAAGSDGSGRRALLIAGAVIGGAALVSGGVCAGVADGDSGLEVAAGLSFVGAGLIGGGTLVYWLMTGKQEEPVSKAAVQVAPAVTARGGGIWISGVW